MGELHAPAISGNDPEFRMSNANLHWGNVALTNYLALTNCIIRFYT